MEWEVLYRDAIQYVHDQSLRGINLGMTADELAEKIKLPPHLAKAPYLQPFYGKVSWSVRSMFVGNLGWFDGDSANLQPLSRQKRAKLFADLAGGKEQLLTYAQKLLSQKKYQAALEISGHLLRLTPKNKQAKNIRVKALFALGGKEQNPNARHYYLTEALEIKNGFVAKEQATPSKKVVNQFPMQGFFDSLAVNLDPKKSKGLNQIVLIRFPELSQMYQVHVRYGVAAIQKLPKDQFLKKEASIKVTMNQSVWKEMLAKLRSPITTLPTLDYSIGNTFAFAKFLKLFEPQKQKLPYEKEK
ncbi:MAG: alkyl sulfatase BDS1-like metallo-beta-lactamase superfamily hydrolase [bacterium]